MGQEWDERLKRIVLELRKRYPFPNSEGNLYILQQNNLDLKIPEVVSGISIKKYFVDLGFIDSTTINDIALDSQSANILHQAGKVYIGDLFRLTPEIIKVLCDNDSQSLQIQNVIDQCRTLYKVDIKDLGISGDMYSVLRYNNVKYAHQLSGSNYRYLHLKQDGEKYIRKCISQYLQDHNYKKRYGTLRITDLNLPAQIVSILRRKGFVYAYEVADGCPKVNGIGFVSRYKIIRAIDEWNTTHTAEVKDSFMSEPEVSADSNENLKQEAQENFSHFLNRLNERYLEDAHKEHLMIQLRRNNTDLPFDEASAWCRLLYDKTLDEYLHEIGILCSEDVSSVETNEETIPASKIDLMQENDISKMDFHQTSQVLSIPKEKEKAEPGKTFDNHVIDSTKGKFDEDYIVECVKKDTELFEQYLKDHNLDYGLVNSPGFIRTLHRFELSEFLKRNQSITYSEYWMIHGLFENRTKDYWKEKCLAYLNDCSNKHSDGILEFAATSFEYDQIRKLCKISTPLYEKYSRISGLQITEKINGKLSLEPCFHEDNYSFDLALTSGGEVLGFLNKTLFRSTGIGLYLAPLLYTNAAVIKNMRLSKDDYPSVIFELHFKD